ncbi:hypothetical protein ASG25_10975 [Rhizobium sp. Leaf384]|uniref:FAD assembly factor SdhE n=1 Tax=unclassified Rhizobium TaxID=2613769 RepID=UPI0007132BF5|nr:MULTISPECIES: succinate dehydrogenase assembly factor 2 [unclassified Rhizobium]KQR69420.1 hypothetical protein ASG03_05290 [Rhizobium sp. Leaf341]KQS79567.1 hypothetical protein ASG25_10975 [Rhizobium sp. Leaf384]KQS82981.1 hypothetical protein ASG58_04790 [Rhizobium sp. Leaf383]
MTGITRTSADLDLRRRKILFRAWHRGLREMDLVFGQFADNELSDLPDADLDELERIMSEEDNDLVKWILGERDLPDHFRTPLFARIAAYRPDFEPQAAPAAAGPTE